MVYISYFENLEKHILGPYLTISPNGQGAAIGDTWTQYEVQTPSGEFYNIAVPHQYHSIQSFRY